MLVKEEAGLDGMARCLHLNPGQIRGLGLSKEDQLPMKVMLCAYGDWGRDGTMAVVARHLDWRLLEVVRQVRGLKYAAAAQGIRRFWHWAEEDAQLAQSAGRLKATMSIVTVCPHCPLNRFNRS